MPARDICHDTVKRALIKEDRVITHDPFWLKWVDSDINVYVDLAAERIIAAEKAGQKIAIEIKSFTGTSIFADFHEALGQYLDYRVKGPRTRSTVVSAHSDRHLQRVF